VPRRIVQVVDGPREDFHSQKEITVPLGQGLIRNWDRTDRSRILGMAAFVALLHVLGWGVLLAFARGEGEVTQGFGVGLGVTAYVLGMRHAFDVDHIVAIDNTARKLIGEGRRPLSVGFWFSLGHSTVVLVLCLLIGIGIRALTGSVTDGSSALQETAGIVGASVSGVFVLLIGVLNARAFAGILRVAQRAGRGVFDEAELEQHLHSRGLIARILAKVTKTVRKDWHMYPIGLLFGLGFDTATEISLLVLSSSAAMLDLPWYATLCLPILFAAGMSLLDSADGVFISAAYEWAFLSPARRIYYNLVITGLSVVVALVIGAAGLFAMLGTEFGSSSGPLAWFANLDLGNVGYAIAGLFLLTWIASMVIWRVGRIDQRWHLAATPPSSPGVTTLKTGRCASSSWCLESVPASADIGSEGEPAGRRPRRRRRRRFARSRR
jgi:high-affinity nickel-transport protein